MKLPPVVIDLDFKSSQEESIKDNHNPSPSISQSPRNADTSRGLMPASPMSQLSQKPLAHNNRVSPNLCEFCDKQALGKCAEKGCGKLVCSFHCQVTRVNL